MSSVDLKAKNTGRTNGLFSGSEPVPGYEAVERLIRENGLRYADFWFTDLPGRSWRITMPAREVSEELFRTGLPLDGQPVGGSWEGVMMLVPRVDSVYRDPAASIPTLAMLCDLLDPQSGHPLPLEPRHLLQGTERIVREKLGALISMGAEPEFILFRQDGRVAGEAAVWDFLRSFAAAMSDAGIQIDWFRTGPAPGQGRIQVKSRPASAMADAVLIYRRAASAIAARNGLTVSFLPRPVPGPGIPGMPMHLALWKEGENLFHDASGWALTSAVCRFFAGGILSHLPALLAFCAPTANSYRRLIPGMQGPADPVLSTARKTAACRIPARNTSPGARRIKFSCPDSMANPYLAFSAVILAGLDGIERKLEPAVDGRSPSGVGFPHCLESALEALDGDRDFLKQDGLFTDRIIDAWIKERWETQVLPVRSRPHPAELSLYDSFEQPGGLNQEERP